MQNFSDLVQGEQQYGNYVIHARLIHALASTLFEQSMLCEVLKLDNPFTLIGKLIPFLIYR